MKMFALRWRSRDWSRRENSEISIPDVAPTEGNGFRVSPNVSLRPANGRQFQPTPANSRAAVSFCDFNDLLKNTKAEHRRQRLSKPPPSASRPPHRGNCKYTPCKDLLIRAGPCAGPVRKTHFERPRDF